MLTRSMHAASAPFQAPPIKPGFVQRPVLFERIRATLLASQSVAMTGDRSAQTATALRALGGFGKTQLAIAIANDPEVRDAFPDGVLWVTLGERPDDILSKVNQLIGAVDPERARAAEREQVLANWRAAFAARRCLIVIDDVWRPGDLVPFLESAPHCARLVTTRNAAAFPADESVPVIEVTVLTPPEAGQLLVRRVPGARPDLNGVADLARALDYWPLFVGLANGMIRTQVLRRGRTIEQAIALTAELLRAKGLDAFAAADETARNRTARSCLDASLDALQAADAAAPGYLEALAAFEEDADIPFDLIRRLWAERGRTGVEFVTTLDLLQDLSFFAVVDHAAATLRLHDMVRDYLRARVGGLLTEQHGRIARAIDDSVGGTWSRLPPAGYGQIYLPGHLRQAGNAAALEALLLDPAWIVAKCSGSGPVALWRDYLAVDNSPRLRTVGRIFQANAHYLAVDGDQAPLQQLLARLDGGPAEDRALIERLRAAVARPALLLPPGTLSPPGSQVFALLHEGQVTSVAFSPDGARVLTGSWDTTARLWDAASGVELRRFEVREGSVNAIAFSPDGARLLTGSYDTTVRLWDAASGAELRRFEGHGLTVTSVGFSPDGARVLTGSWDKTARLWDAASGAELRRFEGHEGWVQSVAFSPDGTRVLTGSEDKTARLWDAASGAELRRFDGHGNWVSSVAFSPDGTRIATGSGDNTVRLWDAAGGAELWRIEGHGGVTSVAFSPNGAQVLTGSWDTIAQLWDAANGAELRRFVGHANWISSVAFSPEGARLLTGSNDWTARLWDVASAAEPRRFEGHDRAINSITFSADGMRVLTGSYDNTARLWDAVSGAELRRFEGHARPVYSAAFSSDGARVLTGSWDSTARLWDAASGTELRRFEGHEGSVHSVAFSPGDAWVLTGSQDKTARLWDAASGAELRRFDGHERAVTSVALSTDGARVLTGSTDNTARLWDAASSVELRRFEGHGNWVTSVAFSSDGARVLTGSWDDTARLWDTASGAELRRFDGHDSTITSVAFSLDGARVLTGSDDSTARLWDVASAAELCRVRLDYAVADAAWHPDGRAIVVASGARWHVADVLEA